MVQLTKNFSLEEVTSSDTAKRLGISNTPDETTKGRLKEAVENMLQPIRDLYGKGIHVNCGYRCPKVNKAVGGSSTSAHVYGYAFDIKPSTAGDMKNLMDVVFKWGKEHKYDQIILEQCDSKGIPSWIHVGWKHLTKGQRKQNLIAKKVNGKWAYSIYKG